MKILKLAVVLLVATISMNLSAQFTTTVTVTNSGGQELKLDAPAGENTDFALQQGGVSKAQLKYVPTSQGMGLFVNDANTGQGVSDANGQALWVSGTSKAVRIGGDSNGGVSTAIPAGYALAVAGRIISEEVKVKLESAGWPDYVFANDYELMPLAELAASIEANNHLPGIPAAAEVEANGITLGEMTRLQMEKIEELTLYIIELQKQIDELK